MNEAEAISRRLDDPHLSADIACGKAYDAAQIGNLTLAHEQEAIGLSNLRRMRHVAPEQSAECAVATAHIAQREGDYDRAISVLGNATRMLAQTGLDHTPRYTSIAHEYARSLSMAGDYRRAWAAEQAVLAIVTEVGRDNTDGYYAMVNVGTAALLGGGQPVKALALLDATTEKSRASAANAQLPFYLSASRLLYQSAAGVTGEQDRGLMQAADDAEKQGMLYAVATFRAGAIRAALDRGDLAAADAYWVKIGPLETKYLGDPAWRRDALRLVLAHARLNLAKQDLTGAADKIKQAADLVPADRQGIDPQWVRIRVLRGEIELAQRQFTAAAADAQMAVDRAKLEAIDPKSSAWVGEALLLRARSELALGDKAAAAASAREALAHVEQNLDPSHPLVAEAKTLSSGT
jgi:hypothetical protein